MRSFWYDPFLWIHLAGFAVLPALLELCVVGLAVGDPLFPVWFELFLVAIAGIAPVIWMQWRRPFYIFSLVAVTLKPEQLTDDQRRLLTLFKTQRHQILAVLVAVVLFFLLRQLYAIAPIAATVVPFPPEWHLVGLLLAMVGFLASNLFLQVPVSVASVMLTSETAFAATSPYPMEAVSQGFTLLGLSVNKILPSIVPATKPSTVVDQPSSIAAVVDAAAPEGGAIAITEPAIEPSDASETPPASPEQSTTLSEVPPPADTPQPEPEAPSTEGSVAATNDGQDPWI